MGENSSRFFALIAENGIFYLLVLINDRFLPKEKRMFNKGAESVWKILLAEGLDACMRLKLMQLGAVMLGNEEWGVALGSLAADIGFALALKYGVLVFRVARQTNSAALRVCGTIRGKLSQTTSWPKPAMAW
ncbi:MAG: hypothetical protein M1383_03930 [Patescibacteria group bacterium]|nr:hypothetical protein [Patescibacteria group bacterium]